jgi:drug/metabolite transporter (DMT)-like permease
MQYITHQVPGMLSSTVLLYCYADYRSQDNICVRGCDAPKSKDRHLFEQPVVQTVQMFIGEMGCWLFVGAFTVYAKYITKKSIAQEGGYQPVSGSDEVPESDAASVRSTTPINPAVKVMIKKEEDRIPLVGFKVLLLALPAICDICGTTLMNVGLLFVEPSIYQMTRGALVLFVGLFSVIFLRRKLYLYQWFALVTVVAGVAVVGLAGWLYHKEDPSESIKEVAILTLRAAVVYVADELKKPGAGLAVIGVLLIAGAQIFTASQFVLEEYILEKYALEPLKVVGWEGFFGFSVTVIGLIVMYLAVGKTSAGRYGYFDVVEGWREVSSYKGIWVSSILIMFSIGYGISHPRTPFLPSNSNTYLMIVVSTSSVCPSPVPSRPPRDRQSTPAEPCSSGSSPCSSAGKLSNGCKSLGSYSWSTELSCSMGW